MLALSKTGANLNIIEQQLVQQSETEIVANAFKGSYIYNYDILYQGLSKHQEVCFTPVTKIPKLIVVFCDPFGAIKNLILKDKYQTNHKEIW